MENPTLIPKPDQKFLIGEPVTATAPNGLALSGTVARSDDASFLVAWAPNRVLCAETVYVRAPVTP